MPFFAAWMSGGICCVEFFAFLRNVDKVRKHIKNDSHRKILLGYQRLHGQGFFPQKLAEIS